VALTADDSGCITFSPPTCGSCSEAAITPIGPSANLTQSWYATDGGMAHDTGEIFGDGEAWTSNAGQDSAGYLLYGPEAGATVSVGDHVAGWNLMIDNIYGSYDGPEVFIEVVDLNTGMTLGSRDLRARDWTDVNDYESFTVPFTVTPSMASHGIEFRCFWWGFRCITAEGCGVVDLQ
jgi:hypothetical protein